MNKQRKRIVEIVGKDDAKWDNCFVDLNTLGYVTNAKFSTYDPPKDLEEKVVYDQAWNKEKNEQ